MNTKPRYPRSQYLLSGVIGGILGVLLYIPWWAITDPIVAYVYTDLLGKDLNVNIDDFMIVLFCWIPAGGLGALLGVISGRVGYAIKPTKWVSIIAAAFGGVAAAFLVGTWMTASVYQQWASYYSDEHQQQYQELASKQEPIPVLNGDFKELLSVQDYYSWAASPDGARLAVGTDDQILVWDLNQKAAVGEPFSNDGKPYQALAFSPDGLTLASGDQDQQVTLWEVQTGKQLARLSGLASPIEDLAFSPDGKRLAAIDLDDSIVLWDPSTGQEIGRLEGYSGFAVTLAFSPDGRLLAAGGGGDYGLNEVVYLWDTATLEPAGQLMGTGSMYFTVHGLAFSPDGSRLAAGNSLTEGAALATWDVPNQTGLGVSQATDITFPKVAYSPDGRRLVLSGFGSSTLYLWDSNSLEALGSLEGPLSDSAEAVFLPDGRLLVCYWNSEQPTKIGIWTIDSP